MGSENEKEKKINKNDQQDTVTKIVYFHNFKFTFVLVRCYKRGKKKEETYLSDRKYNLKNSQL